MDRKNGFSEEGESMGWRDPLDVVAAFSRFKNGDSAQAEAILRGAGLDIDNPEVDKSFDGLTHVRLVDGEDFVTYLRGLSNISSERFDVLVSIINAQVRRVISKYPAFPLNRVEISPEDADDFLVLLGNIDDVIVQVRRLGQSLSEKDQKLATDHLAALELLKKSKEEGWIKELFGAYQAGFFNAYNEHSTNIYLPTGLGLDSIVKLINESSWRKKIDGAAGTEYLLDQTSGFLGRLAQKPRAKWLFDRVKKNVLATLDFMATSNTAKSTPGLLEDINKFKAGIVPIEYRAQE